MRLNDETFWRSYRPELLRILMERMTNAGKVGARTAARQMRIAVDWNFLRPEVLRWAEQSAGALVTAIEDNTRRQVRETISRALSTGQSWMQARDALAQIRDAEDQSGIFSTERAAMIARTEIIRAHAQGAVQGYTASGTVRGLKWRAGQAGQCPVCRELDGKVVALGQKFYTGKFGDGYPPRHPNCRCAISPLTIDEAAKLPADHPLRDNRRESLSELTDINTYTEIGGVRITGERRRHYTYRHATPGLDGEKAQIQDLPRAEAMLREMLETPGATKRHRGATVHYRDWSKDNYLVAIVNDDGSLRSMYIKKKKQVDGWK